MPTNTIQNQCEDNESVHQEELNNAHYTEILIKLRKAVEEEEDIEKQREMRRYAIRIHRIVHSNSQGIEEQNKFQQNRFRYST